MTWTKNSTSTLPATGNRTVILTTENGVQTIRYSVVDNDGVIRAYCDGQCGFTDQ